MNPHGIHSRLRELDYSVVQQCMHCGLCTALCPSKALHLNHETRKVDFDREKCTACNMCVTVCPVHAMVMEVDTNSW